MSENQHYSTRSQRHSQQPKKSNTGKNIFTIISILFVALVLVGGYSIFSMKQHQAQAMEHFTDSAKSLLADIQEERDQSGLANKKTVKGNEQVKLVIYTPQNDSPIPDADKKLTALANQIKKQVKADEMAVLVSKVAVKHVTDQLDTYQLVAEHYRWNEKENTFKQAKGLSEAPVYVSQKTGKAVAIKDVIPSEADLLGIQQVIQQKILDASKKKGMIDKVLTMPRISFDNEITYTPENLTISLPKNDTGTSTITLAYKDIAAYVNTQLVDPATVKDALPVIDPKKKYIALTFDDGPNSVTTPKLLDILKEKNAKATFFMLGENVSANQELVKRVHEEGHEVASHSYSHPQLTTLNAEQVQEEVRKTDKAIFEASGILPRNIRPPYGAIDGATAKTIGKPIIQWDIDSEDWKSKNAAIITPRVTGSAYNGAMILMHDIHSETIAAVPGIIDTLQAQGYEFVTIDTLLAGKQKPLHQYFGMTDERYVE